MTSHTEIDVLKENLAKALTADTINFDHILNLSNDIVKLDPNKVRFSTDAGIIDRLGKELVGRQETAVSELVKNSYDADATSVELFFEKFETKGGKLTIKDNGNGMTRDELIKGFMTLSSSGKVENPVSPVFNRKRAGRKGIGRFATQRLGKKLTIITQSESALKSYKIEIDWEKFVSNTELASISSTIVELPKRHENGTILIIDSLEDSWTEASIKRIYRYLIDLIQPFPLSSQDKINTIAQKLDSKKESSSKSVVDPGFEISIYTVKNSQNILLANTEQNIYEYALAEIEGLVENGQGIWSVKSERLEIDEIQQEIVNNKPYKFLENVYFKVYYFIAKNVDFIPQMVSTFLAEFLKERGGVRVYRNGFRVLPYGEPYNDWLRLDYNYGRRYVLPPFSNENFYGFIEITDIEGKTFQETSSREGLIENEPYNELVNFVFTSVKSAVLRIAAARGRKQTANQKTNWKIDKTPSEQINDAIDSLKTIVDDFEDENKENNKKTGTDLSKKKELQQTLEKFVEAKSQADEEKARLIEEVSMLRVLAGLGLSIATFTHEIKHNYSAILSDANYIIKTSSKEQIKTAQRLNEHLQSFRTYSSYFDRVVSENVHRELKIQDVTQIARKFVEIMKPAANRYSITLHDPQEENYDVFSCKMHWSEWISILLNLFTNSQKAIKRANRGKGEILLRVGKTVENVFIEFYDNGDGILPENQDKIFTPFFTTSSAAGPMADDSDELLGTGLGLKIVKDIVMSYNGDINLIEPIGNYTTCFRIGIPAASSEEIKEYGY